MGLQIRKLYILAPKMKILFVHNSYSDKTPSGEEHASWELSALLEEHGHEVKWFKRSSDEIRSGLGPLKSFFTGIYNPSSARKLAKMLDEYKPDIVQVQNLYPLLSSSIFKPIKKRGIPVVMRCPNYRLFCPAGLCLNSKGEVCEKCFGGKEWHCIASNCEQGIMKSIGYALRNAYSRASHNITNSVDRYIVQSEFQKQKFIVQGIPADNLVILPGICPEIKVSDEDIKGEYVSFVGRVSPEKGIYEFIEAAKMNPTLPFKVAGMLDKNFTIPQDCPPNVEFVGFLKGDELNEFYLKSKIIVVPSKWYEGFPNVITRGMLLKRPVITTNIGAMPSIIDNDVHGFLVEPGNAIQLGESIARLYNDDNKCKAFGIAGYEKARIHYSREAVYNILIDTYASLI